MRGVSYSAVINCGDSVFLTNTERESVRSAGTMRRAALTSRGRSLDASAVRLNTRDDPNEQSLPTGKGSSTRNKAKDGLVGGPRATSTNKIETLEKRRGESDALDDGIHKRSRPQKHRPHHGQGPSSVLPVIPPVAHTCVCVCMRGESLLLPPLDGFGLNNVIIKAFPE